MSYNEKLFNRCFNFVLKNEGGYVNDPDDSGGETYKGIARKFWKTWKGWEIIDGYKNMSGFPGVLKTSPGLDRLVREFYKDKFWNKMHLDLIVNEDSVLQLFDMAINAGIKTAVRIAQRIVNTDQDGILGMKTAFEINSLGYRFFDLYVNKGRIPFYESLAVRRPQNKKFLKGWINRAKNTKFIY